MLYDIVEVRALGGHQLHLRFEDGTEGTVNLRTLIDFKGVFTALENEAYFATVSLDEELGTICWDNGADLSPSFLYEAVKAQAA